MIVAFLRGLEKAPTFLVPIINPPFADNSPHLFCAYIRSAHRHSAVRKWKVKSQGKRIKRSAMEGEHERCGEREE